MSEWFKELVLKTSDSKEPRVRIPISPPFFYKLNILYIQVTIWSSTGVGDGQQIWARPVDDEAIICPRSGQNFTPLQGE